MAGSDDQDVGFVHVRFNNEMMSFRDVALAPDPESEGIPGSTLRIAPE
jgi:hypothetical protein